MTRAWVMSSKGDYASKLADLCEAGIAFSNEPISSWTAESDVAAYLRDVCDHEYESISDTGEIHTGNYADYGDRLFERGLSTYTTSAAKFQAKAIENADSPIPTMHIRIDAPPDFAADPTFGAMAKAAIAWDGVTEAILSESLFFSLAHTFESSSELDCSVLLAENLYYKQALQVLRGLVETCALQLYFATLPSEYQRWIVGDSQFRVPGMRDKKNGLLTVLKSAGILSSELSDSVGEVYRLLNGTIHSTEHRLVHSGLFVGQWAGHQFKRDQFNDWCSFVVRSVDVGIRLFSLTIRTAAALPRTDGIKCDACHSINRFAPLDESLVPGFVSLRCAICTSQRTVDVETWDLWSDRQGTTD